ncbi:hypothetical protein P886_0862 [Alteromonadaceae bacterium 2753L.S.0a.02]|nr:hypothetical protein P886_0862 [Alteromonadaceae bacterium 2753L.S.0a.02]
MNTNHSLEQDARSLLSFNVEPLFALVIPVIFGAAYLQMVALKII